MELRKNTSEINTNIDNSQSFRIKESAKAFKILSDNLYSDKILAVVRELSCNAYDAHVAAKNKKPFDIHLPSYHESYFSVKDYGIGMSHDQVMNLYTSYFDSDKTDSNEYIGALGLGSKSPFAYTDAFTVESIYNGVKRLYTCFIGESGTPQITLLDESKTEHENGVEVKLAVKTDDFHDFSYKTREATKYFKTRPNVLSDNNFSYDKKEQGFFIEGDGWNLSKTIGYNDSNCIAIQGNVAYPIDDKSISDLTIEERFIIRNRFIIDFKIGELDVAASREYLSYDKITVERLKEKIRKTFREFVFFINIEINKLDSLWDAKLYLESLNSNIYQEEAIQEYILYNDKTINLSSTKIRFDHICRIKIIEFNQNYKTIKRKNHTENFYISPTNSTMFVINDRSKNTVGRCKKVLEDNNNINRLFLLSRANRHFFDLIGKPKYKKASSLELPAPIKNTNKRPKGQFLKQVNSEDRKTKFSFDDILDDKIYYIMSSRGILRNEDNDRLHESTVNNMIYYMTNLKALPEGTKVYSIPSWATKEKTFTQSTKTIDFLEFYKKSITNLINKNQNKIIKYKKYNDITYNFDWTINRIVMNKDIFEFVDNENSRLFKIRKEISKIQSISDKLNNDNIGDLISAGNILNIKMPKNENKTVYLSILEDYPMLKTIDKYYINDNLKIIFNYINLVDRS